MTPADALSARDRRIVDALAAGLTQQKAAEAAGCSRATVSRRLRDAQFVRALHAAERQMHSTLVRRLTAEGLAAVGRMAKRANDENATPADREHADARLLSAAVAALPRHDRVDATVVTTATGWRRDQPSLEDELQKVHDRLYGSSAVYEPLAATDGSNGRNGSQP